jgi:CRP-like cAMP-binding protein
VRQLHADSVVVTQSEPAEHVFLLTKGIARYFYLTPSGKKVLFFWLTPGQIFGGAALLRDRSTYLVGTEMVREGSVLVWHRDSIRLLASRFPRLLDNALSIASEYLTWYVAASLGLICNSARERLAHVLVSLADGLGRAHPHGISIEITNEQLADASHCTIYSVSRMMSDWQRKGYLTKSRGRIVVIARNRLFDDAERTGTFTEQ